MLLMMMMMLMIIIDDVAVRVMKARGGSTFIYVPIGYMCHSRESHFSPKYLLINFH